MSNYAISLKRTGLLLAAMTFTALLMVVNFASFFSSAGAAQLESRSLTLASSLPGDVGTTEPANSELNGADTTHTVQFTFPTSSTGTVTGMSFLYCDTAIGACDDTGTGAPTGVDVSGATIAAGDTSGFVIGTNTNNEINVTHSGFAATGTITVIFENITNPTAQGTFFVRMLADNTSADDGTVASSITEGIQITSRVRETLGFSTTGAINNSNVGDPGSTCAALTGSGAIQIGDAVENTLDINTTYYGESAFRIYTNAGNGASVQYQGATLTKGTDTIDAINSGSGTAAASATGTEQFGLAVDTTVQAVDGTYDYFSTAAALDGAEAGELVLDGNYDGGDSATDEFAFQPAPGARTIATSNNNSYLDCATALVRYVANIDPLTPAGTYTTTIVYSAVPTY